MSSQDDTDESQTASRGSSNARASISDHASRTIAIAALIFGAMAFGAVLVAAIMLPSLIDSRAKSAAAMAEAQADIAKTNSLVALDYINNARLELAKKGIEINIDGH